MNFLLVIHCATKKVLELKSDNNNFCSEQDKINFLKSQIVACQTTFQIVFFASKKFVYLFRAAF